MNNINKNKTGINFHYCCEPVIIQRILNGLGAILEIKLNTTRTVEIYSFSLEVDIRNFSRAIERLGLWLRVGFCSAAEGYYCWRRLKLTEINFDDCGLGRLILLGKLQLILLYWRAVLVAKSRLVRVAKAIWGLWWLSLRVMESQSDSFKIFGTEACWVA